VLAATADAAPETDRAAPAPVPAASTGPTRIEQPTEAGLPIFDDDNDDVSWLTARASKPPPPPPFEEAPPRPLFAPDPVPGAPVRTPRPGASTGSQEYWPWDSGTGTGVGAVGGITSTGTGAVPAFDGEDSGVPGRRWLRLAAAIAAAILLVLAVLVGINLGRGRAPLDLRPGTSPSPSPSAGAGSDSGSSPTAAATSPLTGLTAYDFDPQGRPPEENPDLAPRAVDGDPATAWATVTYRQNLGPRGLKTGVGLLVDLGEVRDLAEVRITFVGAPTAVRLFVSDTRPRFVKGLQAVAAETATQQLTLPLTGVSGRWLTVWLTSLPAAKGGFRAEIAEVEVLA
jgi:hypothetical protein